MASILIPLSSTSMADHETQAHRTTTTTPISAPPVLPVVAEAGRISPLSQSSTTNTNTNSNTSRPDRATSAPRNQTAPAQSTYTPPPQTPIQAPRPWWQPPARNFRPHPGNHAINSYITTTSLAVAGSSSLSDNSTAQQQPVYSETLPHYWYRALHYILRIPFRELLGNVSRPYDPTAPLHLADVPLSANIIDTNTHTVYTNPYTGGRSSNTSHQSNGNSNSNSNSNNNSNNNNNHNSIDMPSSNISNNTNSTRPEQSTTHSRHYLPQIRKAWSDRTSSMSWAISTAFFTSVICTVLAVAALALNWGVPSVYLKIFLVVFVVRKWIATFLMADRALYRLPLNLTEPDPDIDEERHNGVAMYMSQLFTWHGYSILIFGQLYVLFYASSHYLSGYPIVTGVALGFSCMGLLPFFALLSLLLLILLFLYFSYVIIYLILWPLNYWGLVQRRAISRMNGGYQSEGTTNTTDLNQVARSLEDAENGRGGGGFGAVDNLRLTPAMRAIPIVVYKKPGGRPVMTSPSAAMAAVNYTSPGQPQQQPQQQQQQEQPQQQQQQQDQSLQSDATTTPTTTTRPDGDQPVVLAMPRPRRHGYKNNRDTQNEALNRMSANLSVICSTPPPHAPSTTTPRHGRSRSSTAISRLSSTNISSIPSTTSSGQEMTETNARRRSASALISAHPPLQTIPSGSGTQIVLAAADPAGSATAQYPGCISAVAFPESHQRSYSTGHVSNMTNYNSALLEVQEYLSSSIHDSAATSPTSAHLPAVLSQLAIASLPAPPSLGTPSLAGSKTTSLYFSPRGSGAASVADESESGDQPQQSSHHLCLLQEVEVFNNGDEECAICLSDFEDGEELRHLYCNHLFHRNCVDRWLVKNAFCPKCKRSI